MITKAPADMGIEELRTEAGELGEAIAVLQRRLESIDAEIRHRRVVAEALARPLPELIRVPLPHMLEYWKPENTTAVRPVPNSPAGNAAGPVDAPIAPTTGDDAFQVPGAPKRGRSGRKGRGKR